MHPLLPPRFKSAAYTLAEMMVSVGIFAIGASIAYPLLVSDMNLYVRNFSINKSNNSLRYALQTLKADIDISIEPPRLLTYSVSGNTGVFTPLATDATVKSADAILLWTNLGYAYDMAPAAGSSDNTIAPASGITLNSVATAPAPQIGDRLVILSPLPYTAGMPETVAMGTGTIQKPGRRITAVTAVAGGYKVQLDLRNALPSGIQGNQSVYVVREVVYAINSISNKQGNAVVERQLITYPSTNDPTTFKLLIRDLDPTPQNTDAVLTSSTYAFNYPNGLSDTAPLRINLPIRALDYATAIADRNLAPGAVDSSATEFNVYLRSNPQMSVKKRLD